jgi:hypothetical protein
MFGSHTTLPSASVSELCVLCVSAFSSPSLSSSSPELRKESRRKPRRSVNLPARHSARVSIKIIPRHLCFLCFHTVTHSFVPSKTLSPIVSYPSTLFVQNSRGGVPPACARRPRPILYSVYPVYPEPRREPRRQRSRSERSEGSASLPILATLHSPFATKSFTIRTSAKRARNSFTMNTSKTKDLKPFRIRTYEKTPGGEGAVPCCPTPYSLPTTHCSLVVSSPSQT